MKRKSEAVKLFGSVTKLGQALGISSQAVSQWPEQLPQRYIDQIRGAALRLGLLEHSATPARRKSVPRPTP